MLKAAILAASAIASGASPIPVQQAEGPARTFVPMGMAFKCQSAGGCYVSNEAGMQEMVDEVHAHGEAVGASKCEKRGSV